MGSALLLVEVLWIGLAAVLNSDEDRTVTFPIEDDHITIKIDGQELTLLLDTGSNVLLVNDGVWYEGKYGKGACEDPRAACYFCPGKRTCLGAGTTIFALPFVQGQVYKFVRRPGSVTLGENTFDGVEFGVVIDFTPPPLHDGSRSPVVLGMGLVSSNNPVKSLLQQLKFKSVIGRLCFSIHTQPSGNTGINGRMVLGEVVEGGPGMRLTPLERCGRTQWNRVTVRVSSIAILAPDGNLLYTHGSGEFGRKGYYLGYVDSGTRDILIPDGAEFVKAIVDHARERIGFDRFWRHPGRVRSVFEKQMSTRSYWFIDEAVLKFFPTLVFTVGSDRDIAVTIPPRDYARCMDGWCVLGIASHQEDRVLLGAPFLRGCDAYVDFESKVVGLRPKHSV
ncbi:hypothetical protein FOZ63_002896 [Perkinsus olseni]|uniref:Peptidase A1 domain-containing protein n=1 Tax=Perkinsus olseni TaxID=32597 RepID=A0A7J6T187_PEROL|nr:hypothetical protein FOZ62_027501 [Perkinsus olseni]KAF4750998.1 hypothetical protein FOZ63_002896 [Perkinsus olseni]